MPPTTAISPRMSAEQTPVYTIEQGARLSQSKLWGLQRSYFEAAGPEAWRTGRVPHYVTSNTHLAGSYASFVFGFFRDLARMGRTDEKVYILELGAGSGRLAYHFLKALERLCKGAAFAVPEYCYVLSDLAASNVEFWKTHPRFGPFASKGQLDFTQLDAMAPSMAVLERGAMPLAQALENSPVIVLANYFFDSIPQDLFYIDGYEISECRTHLTTSVDPETSDAEAILEGATLKYDQQPMQGLAYPDRTLNSLLEDYRGKLQDAHVLFPSSGITCLQRLSQMAGRGLFLISADKGGHRLEDWQQRPAPKLVRHGSFSLRVNYHAIRAFCKATGGRALTSDHMHNHLNMHCMLFMPQPQQYTEVKMAVEQNLNGFGPDDFFSLKKLIERSFDEMNLNEMLAAIRLSGFDGRLFAQMYPRLMQLTSDISAAEAFSLFKAATKVWENYFPLGESTDLAFRIGTLLYQLQFYKEASAYFDISMLIYGKTAGALYNLSLCHAEMGQLDKAFEIVSDLLAIKPDHENGQRLRSELEVQLNGGA